MNRCDMILRVTIQFVIRRNSNAYFGAFNRWNGRIFFSYIVSTAAVLLILDSYRFLLAMISGENFPIFFSCFFFCYSAHNWPIGLRCYRSVLSVTEEQKAVKSICVWHQIRISRNWIQKKQNDNNIVCRRTQIGGVVIK